VVSTDPTQMGDDERRLAELGYTQELERSWSGFTNFAISFSIISILAGCFTTYYQAWNNGGPFAITWGWLLVSAFILIIGFCMAEIVSAFPTAGGVYYWAASLGGPGWGWFTGWFNLIGLVGVVASVDYFCAQFLAITISLFRSSFDPFDLTNVFVIFLVLLAIHIFINLFPSHILKFWNNISAFWHIIGASIVALILIFDPEKHQSFNFVFTERFNNSGFFEGSTSGIGYFFYIIPLGFLLTQYTITGFDSCGHLSEETKGASLSAAKGVWKSIFYSAIGGWILLLLFTFAATNTDVINGVNADDPGFYGVGSVITIFATSLSLAGFKAIMIIAVIGQIFCAGSGMTSASRMLFAFSRDGAVPGSKFFATVAPNRAPRNATFGIAVACIAVTAPALIGNEAAIPWIFYALAGITAIGLYIAYGIPIFLRWRMGDTFQTGPWTLGSKYKWMCPVAIIEIIIVCIYFSAPFSPLGIPGNDGFAFDNGAVQYAGVVVFGVVGLAGIWWLVSAKNWFKGPHAAIVAPPTTPPASDT
jgi:amino acid transporter